jgi:hypothetical protein
LSSTTHFHLNNEKIPFSLKKKKLKNHLLSIQTHLPTNPPTHPPTDPVTSLTPALLGSRQPRQAASQPEVSCFWRLTPLTYYCQFRINNAQPFKWNWVILVGWWGLAILDSPPGLLFD